MYMCLNLTRFFGSTQLGWAAPNFFFDGSSGGGELLAERRCCWLDHSGWNVPSHWPFVTLLGGWCWFRALLWWLGYGCTCLFLERPVVEVRARGEAEEPGVLEVRLGHGHRGRGARQGEDPRDGDRVLRDQEPAVHHPGRPRPAHTLTPLLLLGARFFLDFWRLDPGWGVRWTLGERAPTQPGFTELKLSTLEFFPFPNSRVNKYFLLFLGLFLETSKGGLSFWLTKALKDDNFGFPEIQNGFVPCQSFLLLLNGSDGFTWWVSIPQSICGIIHFASFISFISFFFF